MPLVTLGKIFAYLEMILSYDLFYTFCIIRSKFPLSFVQSAAATAAAAAVVTAGVAAATSAALVTSVELITSENIAFLSTRFRYDIWTSKMNS